MDTISIDGILIVAGFIGGLLLALLAFILPIAMICQISAAIVFRFTRSDERYIETGAIFVLISALAALGCWNLAANDYAIYTSYHFWTIWVFRYFAALAFVPTVCFAIWFAFAAVAFLFEHLINAIRGEPVR